MHAIANLFRKSAKSLSQTKAEQVNSSILIQRDRDRLDKSIDKWGVVVNLRKDDALQPVRVLREVCGCQSSLFDAFADTAAQVPTLDVENIADGQLFLDALHGRDVLNRDSALPVYRLALEYRAPAILEASLRCLQGVLTPRNLESLWAEAKQLDDPEPVFSVLVQTALSLRLAPTPSMPEKLRTRLGGADAGPQQVCAVTSSSADQSTQTIEFSVSLRAAKATGFVYDFEAEGAQLSFSACESPERVELRLYLCSVPPDLHTATFLGSPGAYDKTLYRAHHVALTEGRINETGQFTFSSTQLALCRLYGDNALTRSHFYVLATINKDQKFGPDSWLTPQGAIRCSVSAKLTFK